MIKKSLQRSFIITIALLQVTFFPRISYAVGDATPDTTTTPTTSTPTSTAPADTTTTAPAPAPATTDTTATGPTKPTGADSDTYTYNESTGLWENAYYTWNPTTKQTAPKPGTSDYSYNPATQHWDSTEWRYDAPSGKYVPNVVETATLPAGAVVSPTSTNPTTATLANPTTTSTTSTSGPASPTNSNKTTNTNGAYDLFYNANISNKVTGVATSGDATVAQNTLGGNAGTGDASDMATIINMLQSVWDPSNGKIATFTADINGDVNGDITIDPGKASQSLNVDNTTNNANLAVKDSENAAINNNIDLSATSGNAKVTDNTTAGDATTGTANAVANVVNLLNSYIGAGQSFVGTVNVNGNLNGDILLPPQMLDDLLASNVPRATIDLSKVTNSNIAAQFNDNTNINNNVDATAASGNANVSNNSSAGDATTGNANTNVTVLNLTGRQIIGSNALLVFVNVLGKWVGMIMDAPGATSAAIGGGITSDTTDNLNATLTSDSNASINNNIKLAAQSGNADVSSNSHAGNAKTGDASASANIANVSNSKFSLTGWFGVLFINVFGNWLGSFGVNTSAGNQPTTSQTSNTPQPDVKVFGFTPHSNGTYTLTSVPTIGNLGTGGQTTTNTTTSASPAQVLGASIVKPVYPASAAATGLNPVARAYIILAFAGLFITLGGKLVAFLKARRL